MISQQSVEKINPQNVMNLQNIGNIFPTERHVEKINPQNVMNLQNIGNIFPTERHHLTVSGDYDTYMMSSNVSLKEGSRAASQGKINIEKKDFDVKTLILPEIATGSKNHLHNSISTQILDHGSMLVNNFKQEHTMQIEEDQMRVNELNLNTLINPSWGQSIKTKGLDSNRVSLKPKIAKSQSILNLREKEVFGAKKKKNMFLTKLKLQKNDQMPSLP
eukprot:CAMPEP_0168352636 /NCGR_PEP_ID=MMETSP0213-20121227/22708_1 /TAXON_ID=151035 /ORGANISM="Euplotes harpa, Strain FSP1.4" /LENGTH=217 /DNA_ID=CAMNT_0008363963 /DNA_START=25 /DNA_END=674 /DNA_ORIENTATION=-